MKFSGDLITFNLSKIIGPEAILAISANKIKFIS